MKTIEFLVDEESSKKISSIDSSIAHWSVQHTRLHVQAQEALATVKNLYEAHGQVVLSVASGMGYPKNVVGYKVVNTPQGKLVQITINEDNPSAESVDGNPESAEADSTPSAN